MVTGPTRSHPLRMGDEHMGEAWFRRAIAAPPKTSTRDPAARDPERRRRVPLAGRFACGARRISASPSGGRRGTDRLADPSQALVDNPVPDPSQSVVVSPGDGDPPPCDQRAYASSKELSRGTVVYGHWIALRSHSSIREPTLEG